VSGLTAGGPRASQPPIGKRGRLALAVAAAVDTVEGARRADETNSDSTQYAGGRVAGIRLGEDEICVHIVAESLPLDPLVETVRLAAVAASRGAGDERPVRVAVDDLDVAKLPRGPR
jgi:hypothetical protein